MNNEDEFREVISSMVGETHSLFGTTIRTIRKEDERKTAAKSVAPRHRLLVLLNAAELTLKGLPKTVTNPWFIAELKATIEVVRKWKTEPIWKEIEPSLVNSSTFTHTVVMLQLAEHLRREGHQVEVIPTSTSPTPDLRIKAIGGTQEWFRVEFYQPSALDGFRGDLTDKQVEGIVKKIRDKASAQIRDEIGVVAVCGYNQSKTNVAKLRLGLETWLQRTTRTNFGGVILEVLSVLFRRGENELSFQPTISVEFIANPNYFGNVSISDKTSGNAANLISEPLSDINTEDILKGIYAPMPAMAPTSPSPKAPVATRSLSILDVVESDRAVIVDKTRTLPFLFRGEGDIDYVCGGCGRLLVSRTWRLSLSNIVLECPTCESNNTIPMMPEPSNPKFNRIGIAEGRYMMESAVELKRGIQLMGMKMGKERLQQMIERAKAQESGNKTIQSALDKADASPT